LQAEPRFEYYYHFGVLCTYFQHSYYSLTRKVASVHAQALKIVWGWYIWAFWILQSLPWYQNESQ